MLIQNFRSQIFCCFLHFLYATPTFYDYEFYNDGFARESSDPHSSIFSDSDESSSDDVVERQVVGNLRKRDISNQSQEHKDFGTTIQESKLKTELNLMETQNNGESNSEVLLSPVRLLKGILNSNHTSFSAKELDKQDVEAGKDL